MNQEIPEKPPAVVMKLCNIWPIHTIHIWRRYTSEDTEDTMVVLKGTDSNGKEVSYEGEWAGVVKYLTLRVDYHSVACVNEVYKKMYFEWKKFEENNASELSEYERLKKKFG